MWDWLHMNEWRNGKAAGARRHVERSDRENKMKWTKGRNRTPNEPDCERGREWWNKCLREQKYERISTWMENKVSTVHYIFKLHLLNRVWHNSRIKCYISFIPYDSRTHHEQLQNEKKYKWTWREKKYQCTHTHNNNRSTSGKIHIILFKRVIFFGISIHTVPHNTYNESAVILEHHIFFFFSSFRHNSSGNATVRHFARLRFVFRVVSSFQLFFFFFLNSCTNSDSV